MQQIRNARVFAPAQKRDLDIGAKTYSDIGLAGFRKWLPSVRFAL